MPQWNCACPNCQAARRGLIPARTQSCVAISVDGARWYLVNASPDLAVQIQGFSELGPRKQSPRNSPIAGIFLTNADLDHVLGVFSLREGDGLEIVATKAVRAIAEKCLGIETVLNSFCGSRWHEPVFGNSAPVRFPKGTPPGLQYRAIELGGKAPRFASSFGIGDPGQSVAYEFLDDRTHSRLVIAPDVAEANRELLDALDAADIVLFDGTFWSADELRNVRTGAPAAAEMGHMTIRDGSLKLLQHLPAKAKVYIHINNTNPILAANSPERAAVEAASIVVGQDGLEFEL